MGMKGVALCLALMAFAGCNLFDSSPTEPTPEPTPQPPTVQGQWTGTYLIQTCAATGAAAGTCEAPGGPIPGGDHSLTLTLTQSGDSVNGTLGLGNLNIPVAGPISIAGILHSRT